MEKELLSKIDFIRKDLTLRLNKSPACMLELSQYIEIQKPLLRSSLFDEEITDTEKLCQFIDRYIHSAPDLLTAFLSLSKDACITTYTYPFLQAAAEYFFLTDKVIKPLDPIPALFCRAYLCHRMLEELNDQVHTQRKLALAPSDHIHTNLLAHSLIGDETANKLDQTLLIEMELLNSQIADIQTLIFKTPEAEKALAQLLKQGWKSTLERWPFLGEELV